ncbi:hypothetical protein ILUMI_08007 [Ignelater luminosus]|uniref:Ribosomal L1 domain-containing protein 1 n=1 Tax=Ignelater luminosus TaxID=2038154 RepID=A0A8K0D6E9_IGNLU|nr:hypothetical protein ILUMI_08007 [Ignelater luminosus]
MGKVKRISGKLAKPTLKASVLKRRSLKHSTPMPKRPSVKYMKQKLLLEKSPEFSNTENLSELESDSSMQKTEGQFVKAPNSIDRDQIRDGVKALFEYILKSSESKTELLDDDQPIFLQITAIKIPNTPNRQIRLLLKHSLLSEESEICLIVQDIGNPKDHDETIEHYQRHLIDHNITRIKTIIPYHQFKSEYGNQYELKRKLLGLYDYFLVDGRISGYVTQSLGKIFLEKRKSPTSIKMDASNLKDHVEKALKKTIMKMHSKGDSYLVQVGHSKMREEDVFENICEVIDELSDVFPGSLDNIRQLGLKTVKGLTVPIYLTLKNQNTVNVTVVRQKRPKEFKSVTGELSTYLKKDVTVLPGGKVIIMDKNNGTENDDEDYEEFVDSDLVEDEDSDLFEEDEDQAQSDMLDTPGSDNGSEEMVETNKNEKGSKKQIQPKTDENDSEEDDLIEAEQMYLSEYEQKKVNTIAQKQEVKLTKDKSEGKETSASLKVSHISVRKNKNKNQVNQDEPFIESSEENKDIGKDVLRSNQADNGNNDIEQPQISQQSTKGSKKKVKLEENSEESSKIKPKNIKGNNTKKNKKIAPEAVQNETKNQLNEQSNILPAVEERRTGRARKKRDSPLKNENTSENIPPKKSKKMPIKEISDVVEDQVPKKQMKTTTQANRKRKDTTKDDENQGEKEKTNVKQTKKGKKKGNNDVDSKATRTMRSKKLEETSNIENKKPTRKPLKNVETPVDNIAQTSQQQKTAQNKNKQVEANSDSVDVPAPVQKVEKKPRGKGQKVKKSTIK